MRTPTSLFATTPPARRQQGFTVVEMVITLFVLALVLVGVLQLFDLAGNIGRVQADVAEMQQTLRATQYDVIRLLRMSGRGSVPATAPGRPLPTGIAIEVTNDVPADTFIDPDSDHPIVPGTDVLIVRGVFNSPVWVPLEDSFVVSADPTAPDYGEGSFQVANVVATRVAVPQSLTDLVDAIQQNRPEALVIVSDLEDAFYHIVELDPARCVIDDATNPTLITVGFRFTGGVHTDAYWALSGNNWDPQITDIAQVGIVDEYRFYIEDLRENPADDSSPPRPRLVRARTYPGTQVPYADVAANWAEPIGDNVYDLQVALGIETGGADPFHPDDQGNDTDEWLYNSPDDDDTEARWQTGRLYYARVTTSTFAERRDIAYRNGATIVHEDHSYTPPAPGTTGAVVPDSSFRRRSLRTVVDLRNLS